MFKRHSSGLRAGTTPLPTGIGSGAGLVLAGIAAAAAAVAATSIRRREAAWNHHRPADLPPTTTPGGAAFSLFPDFGLAAALRLLREAASTDSEARWVRFHQVVSGLGALDFTPTLSCEHSRHATRHANEPASYLIKTRCPGCGFTSEYLICRSGLEQATQAATIHHHRHRGCRGKGALVDNLVSRIEI